MNHDSRSNILAKASEQTRAQGSRDSVRVDQVMVAVHDTIVEKTTITIRENEAGDTVQLSRVTERDRIRDRAQVKNKEVEVRVVRDTVFIEKRNSVSTITKVTNPTDRASPLTSALKWIFGIIIGVTALLIILKIR